jgi:hypothetical protein
MYSEMLLASAQSHPTVESKTCRAGGGRKQDPDEQAPTRREIRPATATRGTDLGLGCAPALQPSVICHLSFVILRVPIGLSHTYGGNYFSFTKARLYCAKA